jgi:hypothetical protein
MASSCPTIVNTYGPVRGGIRSRADESPGPVRFGPSTAPIVVAHTTIERVAAARGIGRQICCANRDCRLAACPRDRRKAASSRGNEPTRRRARRGSPRPGRSPCGGKRETAAAAAGRARAGSRISAVRGHRGSGQPRVALVAGESAASTAPSDIVAPNATPPSTCATTALRPCAGRRHSPAQRAPRAAASAMARVTRPARPRPARRARVAQRAET